MKHSRSILISILLLLSSNTYATLISENIGGTKNSVSGIYWGQSVITSTGGDWTDISLNFYSGSTAIAWDDLYLLSNEYLGTPSGLSSASNVLGVASASGGLWSFDSSVILSSNTQYWFYTESALTGSLTGNNDVSGTSYYWTGSSSSNFALATNDINYTLTGTAVPEPSIFALMGIGLAGIGFVRRRKTA